MKILCCYLCLLEGRWEKEPIWKRIVYTNCIYRTDRMYPGDPWGSQTWLGNHRWEITSLTWVCLKIGHLFLCPVDRHCPSKPFDAIAMGIPHFQTHRNINYHIIIMIHWLNPYCWCTVQCLFLDGETMWNPYFILFLYGETGNTNLPRQLYLCLPLPSRPHPSPVPPVPRRQAPGVPAQARRRSPWATRPTVATNKIEK